MDNMQQVEFPLGDVTDALGSPASKSSSAMEREHLVDIWKSLSMIMKTMNHPNNKSYLVQVQQ